MLSGTGLIAVYLLYSWLTGPWLQVERSGPAKRAASVQHEESPVFAEQAWKWFQQDPWVQTANARFRDGSRLLYFNEYDLDENSRSIAIRPVAFLWQSDDEKPPITATADSAQLDSDQPFSFQEARIGRIVSGYLSGDVRISGPDGLRIEGRGFHISEDSMKIWTSQPVHFAWGPHSGKAESGADIELLASGESSKTGLLAVNNVQRLRLRGRVHCNLSFPDEDSRRESVILNVTSANGFEFFVPTLEATFLGFADRVANLDNQVLVERPVPGGGLDRLYCSQLKLNFHPRIQNTAAEGRISQLDLARITAEGTPVEFQSITGDTERVYATMGKLRYHLRERIMELMERAISARGRRIPVDVHQGGMRLTTHHALIAMSEENDVHTIECRGDGRLVPSPRQKDAVRSNPMGATWKQNLLIRRGPEHRVTLRGDVRVVQAGMDAAGNLTSEFSLTGDVIEMYLRDTASRVQDAAMLHPMSDPENGENLAIGSSMTDSGHRMAAEPLNPVSGMDFSQIRPRLMVARGNVVLSAPQMEGVARDQLLVHFRDDNSDGSASDGPDTDPSAVPVRPASHSTESTGRGLNGMTNTTSDTIEATVKLVESGKPEFEEVWLKGGVEIVHLSNAGAGSEASAEQRTSDFTARGNMLQARGGFQNGTEITLFGDPAAVINASNRIEGPRIDLSNMNAESSLPRREARVEGSGRMRLIVNTGMDGKPLTVPSFLDIYWGDHMSFSGKTAHFVGNIRAVMNNRTDHDVEVTCAGMKVHFTSDVTVESSGPADELRIARPVDQRSGSPEIERIECQSKVVVRIDLLEEGKIRAHHYAEFADFVFNQQTGDFHATGPGLIEFVQPDKGRRRISSGNSTVARSNAPASTVSKAWYFIHANFIGSLDGNRDQRFVRLRQHIRGVVGPVQQVTDRITIDGVSPEDLPDNTGAIECENLTVEVIPGVTVDQPMSFSLVARSNGLENLSGTRSPCRFNSRLFGGVADQIKYDHSKEQFILLADQNRQATVTYHRDGSRRQVLNGGRFEYYADRNHLIAHQITGVQSSGELDRD